MKYESYTYEQEIYIHLSEKELNTKSLTQDSAFPMINKNVHSVVMDLKEVLEVDATGVAWLIEFGNRLSKLGAQIYITDSCAASQAVKLLGLESLLPSTNKINHKQAI